MTTEETTAPPPPADPEQTNGEPRDEEATESAPPSAEKLTELITAADLHYSLKNYTAAADLFSSATEMQAALNGEMDPRNADLLFRYGRCLYKLAVQKSDVLGGKVAADQAPKKKQRAAAPNGESSAAGASTSTDTKPADSDAAASNPFFHITGDENWDTSEDEDEDEQAAQEEEDDLANAYEILDLARVLLERRLDAPAAPDAEVRDTKELLADTRDYQAEISLENERFADAVADSARALALKRELYPPESEVIAEAHFKHSLALEFASVSSVREAEGGDGGAAALAEAAVDEGMRRRAGDEMEQAIASCRLRVAKEEAAAAAMEAGEAREKKLQTIADVKEMVGDMEQRLQDLRAPFQPPSMTLADAQSEALQGLLGTLTGASAFQQQAKLEEATKNANDISGLVRTRKKEPAAAVTAAAAAQTNGKGKRKLEAEPAAADEGSKKAKVEDASE